MDLESLPKLVFILQKYIESESKIASLEEKISRKNDYITLLQTKLKAFTENSQLKSYISGLEKKVKELQEKIEELEIVIIK